MKPSIEVVPDAKIEGAWRVEQMDEDGGFAITIFVGAGPEQRAHEYANGFAARPSPEAIEGSKP